MLNRLYLKRNKIFFIIFLFFSKINYSFSQEAPSDEFGVFDHSLLTQKVFSIDSSAEAITLYEKYTVNFIYDHIYRSGFYIQNIYHIRKKILKKTAFDQGLVNIHYYSGSKSNMERISNIKVATYNNGEVSFLDDASKFDTKIINDYYHLKLVLPNLQEGSIIEYQYQIDSPLHYFGKPKDWYFQSENPTLYSEVDVSIPNYFSYHIIQSGYLPLSFTENKKIKLDTGFPYDRQGDGYSISETNGTKYRFVVNDAPAFKKEEFITTTDDYISKISFELAAYNIPNFDKRNNSTTWSDVDRTLFDSDYWGKKIKKNNYLSETVEQLSKVNDLYLRLQSSYNFMTKNFKWNKVQSKWIRGNLEKIFENKTGTASELNGIMYSLLSELNFEVNPVIISTRENGKINLSFPSLDNFNYTINQVIIAKDTFLIDVTDPLLKLGSLPKHCLNQIGRKIKSRNEGEMIEIKPIEKYTELESFTASFNGKTNKLSGNYIGSFSGYAGYDMREKYKSLEELKFKKQIVENHPTINIQNISLENIDEIDKIFTTNYDFEKNLEVENPDIIYIEPLLFGKITKNPFTKPTRDFPIDFGYGSNYTVIGKINIPVGYSVDETPKNMIINLPENGGKFTYSIQIIENIINIQSRFLLNKPIYGTGAYQSIKELYNRIIQKHAEQIVLKKK